jgi:hypothetical protein
MHGFHAAAATREPAWTAPVDRKTALKLVGSGFVLLASAAWLRPSTVKADHDGT